MVFSAVAWKYRDPVTSAKLAQMVENLRTHDHRADGTQGTPTPLRKVATGTVTENRAAAGVTITPIVFPVGRFSTAPDVFVSVDIGGTALLVTAWGVSTITAAGCDVRVYRTNASNTPIHWVAIERVP